MGHVEVAHLRYQLPTGRVLFDDVSFRVGEGAKVALVGANGSGKTTLLSVVAGDATATGGAVTCEGLELTGLTRPFDTEVWYGDRVAVLGGNGTGKSHFLRLLAGDEVAHSGAWKPGARVVPGYFAQTHERPDLLGRPLIDVVWHDCGDRQRAWNGLRRYGLHHQGEQPFETLSGGQQARLQILLLELSGATLLLLDEPTDNLDLESADALEEALGSYRGTVLAVTHDRWFARSFDRFLLFNAGGEVLESPEPVWDASRVPRAR